VRDSRLLDNRNGIVMLGSGHATHVLVERNQIVSPGAMSGIYAGDTRWRGYQNRISGPSWGVYHRLPRHRHLPISDLRGNLITDVFVGVTGAGLDRHELRVRANTIGGWRPTFGLVASDVIDTRDAPDRQQALSASLDFAVGRTR